MMTRRLLSLAWLVLLGALLAGCGPKEGESLLVDRFSDPRSGWGSDSQDAFDRGYEEGEYFIEVYEHDWFAWAPSGNRFADVEIEVKARRIPTSSDGHFGVLCRYRSPGDFYYLGITEDGYYAIMRVEEGDARILTGDGFAHSPLIRPRGGKFYLRAVCAGDELSLYVSDALVARVSDDTFRRGDVGLGVGSASEGSIRVHFDDLVVRAVEVGE